MNKKSYFDNRFEIWTKEKIKIGTYGKLGDMEFKVLKCEKVPKGYALLCREVNKIALLTPTFNQWSGPDRVAEEKAKTATKMGHDVTVFTMDATIKSQS